MKISFSFTANLAEKVLIKIFQGHSRSNVQEKRSEYGKLKPNGLHIDHPQAGVSNIYAVILKVNIKTYAQIKKRSTNLVNNLIYLFDINFLISVCCPSNSPPEKFAHHSQFRRPYKNLEFQNWPTSQLDLPRKHFCYLENCCNRKFIILVKLGENSCIRPVGNCLSDKE